MDPMYCTQRPAVLISLLCSLACPQTKHHNKIIAEITVAVLCRVPCVMVWLCSNGLIAWVMAGL